MRKIKYIFTVLFAGLLLTSCSMFEKEGAERASVSFKLDTETVQKIKKAAGETSSATARVADSDGLFIEVLVKGEYQARVPQALQEDAEITIKNIPLGVKIFVEANIYKMEKQTRKDLYTGHSKTFVVHENDNQVIFVLHKIAGNSESGNQGGGGNGGEGGNGSGEGGTDPFPNELPANVVFVANNTAGGSSSNDGSEEHPLDSIEHAVGKIKEIVEDANSGHSNDEEWGIVLLSDLSGSQRITDEADSYMSKLVLASKDAKDIKTLDGGFTTAPADDASGANIGTTLFITSMKTVTLQCVKITGGWANEGGGIRFDGNHLYLKPGVEIYGNKAKYEGAGICAKRNLYIGSDDELNITIDGAVIGGEAGKENICTGGDDGSYPGWGGGIHVGGLGENTGCGMSPVKFTIEKCYIKGNKAGEGAGINVIGQCEFIINDGTISGNSINYDGGLGAGIYIDTIGEGSFILNGGTISSNTAAKGRGIYSTRTTLGIFGGTISSNTATSGLGTAIYFDKWNKTPDFFIKANPVFGKDDYIFIADSNSHLSSHPPFRLTPISFMETISGNTQIATIQPEIYQENDVILSNASASISTEDFAALCRRFNIATQTKDNSGNTLDTPINWIIDDSGKLQKQN